MKRFVLGICIVLALLVGFWTYAWWHSPAETKEFSAADQTTQGVLGSKRTLVSWDTQYFTTRYPDDLRIITSNEIAHGITTGQYLLGATSLDATDQLAVTVGEQNDAALDELPAVKLRQQRSDVYEPVTLSFTPVDGRAFSMKDGSEMAVFWNEGSRYAAVVVSGSQARQVELEQALEAVVVNWQWRS